MALSGESNGTYLTNEISSQQFLLDSLEVKGDARSAWEALQFCLEANLPLPKWVQSYLLATSKEVAKVSRTQPLTSLWEALGLYYERKPDLIDFDNDPEEIYKKIESWKSAGIVKTISAGVNKYILEILKDKSDKQTIRTRYQFGRKPWNSHDPKNQY